MTSHTTDAAAGQLPEAVTKLIPFVKAEGQTFTAGELDEIRAVLDGLGENQRESVRNANADGIAANDARRMLVISGPGTGKSTLFIGRLRHWLAAHPKHHVSVATFVRKLVTDLNEDIKNDSTVSDEDKKRVSVRTLHRTARGIVESNHGTKDLPLRPFCRIVSPKWEEMVWSDAFVLNPEYEARDYPWAQIVGSLYDAEPRAEAPWLVLRKSHILVQRLYNALTFPDLILVATQALRERPALAADTLFIIDEFQDFNLADRELIRALTTEAPGLLLAGDDDQVLYDQLRRGHASIIRDYYQDAEFAKAVLPFCSRCSFHICRAAESFLMSDRPQEAIPKLFLPIHDPADPKVVIAAATSPTAGVAYIERFVEQHKGQLEERAHAISEHKVKDPYLLLLTPARKMRFLNVKGALRHLEEVLAPFRISDSQLCEDYWIVRDYYYLAKDPTQNFSMRKVFAHEEIDPDTVASLIKRVASEERDFIALDDEVTGACLEKSAKVRQVIESGGSGQELVGHLRDLIPISSADDLVRDLDRAPLTKAADPDDETPEFGQSQSVTPVQVVTIVGAKGLSADHVVVLGCDDVNLQRTTRNAFFVAMTRARKSLTLLACVGGGGASMLHNFVAALPDQHSQAVYAKADETIECRSIAELEDRLKKLTYARTAWKRSFPKRR
jgi:superfamily I DNA/RNA helicase